MDRPALTTPRYRIRTPDQRLRVFVSSTLKELAPERKVARAAIERIAAAPVMFELGARPHPPRALYRAYLEQSDIFVGLYWEKYGWVAPDEKVSGLEDEYNLAPPTMPRLIYIKETTGTREPRLEALLDRIKADDRASFKTFSDASELADLLVMDLATLLAERFDESRPTPAPPPVPPAEDVPPPAPPPRPVSALPMPLTQIFGREEECSALVHRLRSPGVRLITLTGPGGIGKTRLAIEVARRLEPDFPDGVLFVPLAPVDNPAQVPSAIAQVLGVRDTGDLPLEQKLGTAFRDRRALLVLDNFEHVLPAASLITAILEGAHSVKILVTSRALLRLSGEHSFDVAPLELPAPRTAPWSEQADVPASVALFVERARSVKPDFELTPENIDAVEGISFRLEGVPLAIELAAARIRLLSPAALLERLDSQLALLVGGQRNLPARQQAVRSTIEWSTRLLGPRERNLLWQLGGFAGRFSLEAAEAVTDVSGEVLSLLEALVDTSLLRQQDRGGRTYFQLLATVREYALEQLEEQGLLEKFRNRHMRYFVDWGRRMGKDLIGRQQRERVAALHEERDNLRAAVRHLLDVRDWRTTAEFAWALLPYWWIGGLLGEVRGWMEEMLAAEEQVSGRARAIALYYTGAIGYWQESAAAVVPGLEESVELFRGMKAEADEGLALISLGLAYVTGPHPDLPAAVDSLNRSLDLLEDSGHLWGAGLAHIAFGRIELLRQDVASALRHFERALDLAEQQQDSLALTLALHHVGMGHLLLGNLDTAMTSMQRGLQVSVGLHHDEFMALGLEGFIGVAAVRGDIERAGLLTGAARALRERAGMFNPTDYAFAYKFVKEIRAGSDAALFERNYERGRRMSPQEAVDVALALVGAPAPAAAPGS
ncbi:DUF4062 domain-containing protein [Naasia sp. SYSU D00948]|uniref:DUF4062 domain-containing protein n=1 Tax=Naasia sp. SYSU D00948 TaxID=2817379 RepID=UPI001B316237|nr:DUF4062 domain-containing protein [Naasia sp. SYSU D00948]